MWRLAWGLNEAVEPLALKPGLDNCLLQHFEDHITSLKVELDIVQAAILLEDNEGLFEQHSTLEKDPWSGHDSQVTTLHLQE